MKTTLERLRTIVLRTYMVDPATLTGDLSLDQLGIDSLGTGLLLFDAEDEFRVKFFTEPGKLRTLGDVVRYIDEVIATQPGAATFATAATGPPRQGS